MEQNTPHLWDRLWQRETGTEEDRLALAREESGIRWRRLEAVARRELNDLAGLRVVEIGAGAGTVASLMARRGASITLLDFSPAALERARQYFGRNGLQAEFVLGNALELPAELKGRFDISMSFGLAEHFAGERRDRMIDAHFDLLRAGGLAFISVPNALNLPYRIYKKATELTGKWPYGEEYPFSRLELARHARRLGLRQSGFFGENMFDSLQVINPLRNSGKLRRLLRVPERYGSERVCRSWGSPLDGWLAMSIVLWGRRPQ